MAAPNCSTDVCNLSLDLLGQAAVVANIETPTNDTEELMSRHYDQAREKVLRMHPWNFATAFAQCTRIGTPLFDYRDQYQLPSDFIRLLSVGGQIEQWQEHNYRIHGQTLLMNNSLPTGITPTIAGITQTTTDVTVVSGETTTETVTTVTVGTEIPGEDLSGGASINIRYIRNEADITKWDPCAIDLLVHMLAQETAYQVTKQEDVVSRITKLIAQIIPDAYAINGQENVPKRIEHSRSIEKRRFQLNSAIVASPYTILL